MSETSLSTRRWRSRSVDRARSDGLQLTGEDGLLQQLAKRA